MCSTHRMHAAETKAKRRDLLRCGAARDNLSRSWQRTLQTLLARAPESIWTRSSQLPRRDLSLSARLQLEIM